MDSRLPGWIKGRRGAAAPWRWLLRAVLLAWKAARCLPLADRVKATLKVDGHRFTVRSFSYDDLLCASAEYEACLADLLPPSRGVAVDAGAFIGRHTLTYARAVGPDGRVVAVEPLPANHRLLVHNVRQNGYCQVTCAAYALGREDGEAWLTYDRETSTASTKRRMPRRCRVPQQSLDHLLGQLGIDRVDLLKIDVEGAELDVLEGSRQILAASPRARLILEIHDRPTSSRCRVERWLADRGYAVKRLSDGPRLFYLAEPDAQGTVPGPAIEEQAIVRKEQG